MDENSENLIRYVGARIRELREDYNSGEGLSQQALALALNTTANTISRWETGTYKPRLPDLDKLSRFFSVSILSFFPEAEAQENQQLSALLRTAKQLDPDDLEELQRYAEFRKARSLHGGARPRKGRKKKQ